MFSTQVVDKGGYCTVSFTVTYPQDVAPHSRQIRTEIIAHGFADDAQDYALPTPPLAIGSHPVLMPMANAYDEDVAIAVDSVDHQVRLDRVDTDRGIDLLT